MKIGIIILSLIILFFVAGCSHDQKTAEQTVEDIIDKGTNPVESINVDLETQTVSNWRDIGLTNIKTQKKFKISDFKGKNILLESFAVWCPTCRKQQIEMQKLQAIDKETIHVSLDTDPNEDESIVKSHIDRNLFDWYFAVSPPELTKALIDEFGTKFVFAPGAPVVLICKDQSARSLKTGVKSAEKLKEEIGKGC